MFHPESRFGSDEVEALVAEQTKEAAEERRLYEEELALCEKGLCSHYTCTEGADLAEWEAFERLAGRG